MTEKNPFLGATFAERQAIREARSDVEPEQVAPDAKQVDGESDAAENKAVKSASTKRTRKTAAKKS